jgi:hypothetical protein
LPDWGEAGLKTLPLPAQQHGNARGINLIRGHINQGENKMLRRGSIVLSILFWLIQFFLLRGYAATSLPGNAVGFIAEFGLPLWLLIMGAKDLK